MSKSHFIVLMLVAIGCCTFFGCAEKEAQNEEFASIVYPANYARREFIDSSGFKNIEIDSLQFKISWKFYNEHFKIKHIIDTLIKIDSVYHYKDDSIWVTGLRTYPHNAEIGTWTHKTKNGNDSIVDFDAKLGCNYFEALKIAEKEGFNLPYIEVMEGMSIISKDTIPLWSISRTKSPEPTNYDKPYLIVINGNTCTFTLYGVTNPIASHK